MKSIFFLFLCIGMHAHLQGQMCQGFIFDTNSQPLAYVNVGLLGKIQGTTSDSTGFFQLQTTEDNHNDTIVFSMIGFEPKIMKVSELLKNENNNIVLTEKIYGLKEVVVYPSKTKEKILGNRHGRVASGGNKFEKGMELGVIINTKNRAYLKSLLLNISVRDNGKQYMKGERSDSVFYRLNIYKVTSDNEFVNEQSFPVYIRFLAKNSFDIVEIDLSHYNLVVEGKTLVAIEYISDDSRLMHFRSNLIGGTSSYIRPTSQANLIKIPYSLSIAVKTLLYKN